MQRKNVIELGLLGRSLMPLLVVMMMLTLRLVAAPTAQAADGATETSAVVLAVIAGSGTNDSSVLLAPLADDPPAAESEDWWTSTKTFMSKIIQTLNIIVWFVVAIGVVLLVIAHFAQSILPDWAQQFKGYLPKGVVLIIVMNVVLTIVAGQLEGETITGTPDWGDTPEE